MKRWLVAGGAALAALVVLEAVLRLGNYATPDLHQLDARLGWSGRAHKQGWYAGDEGRTRVVINPAGFRDRERALDKPDPVYRIAVLGDEYSEAMPVALRDIWWWQLEPKLQHCDFRPGKLVEVLNFGVAGYATAQELILLQSGVMRYAPDLVLLQFSPDDVIDNSFALAENKARPFYFLDAHGVPRVDESFAESPSFQRRMQTRYRLAAEIADHTRAIQLARELARLSFIAPAHAEPDIASGPLYDDAWKLTEALIGKAADYTRRNGAQFALLAIPPARRATQPMEPIDARLVALGKKLHVPVISLAGRLASAHYAHAGGWTTEGNHAAAAAIANQLCGGQVLN